MKWITLSCLLIGSAFAESTDPTHPADPRMQEALRALRDQENTPVLRGADPRLAEPRVHLRARVRQGDQALVLVEVDGEAVLLAPGDEIRLRQHRLALLTYDENGVRIRLNDAERRLR
ncbi:MAG: hypothetical protein JJU05_09175 [Verrucomicrobia bacterium]|nr:hypothetical protein [Verrucomicrobiota bacterium]MCH8527618.1 hypothetical protein [Kiritimatiellia bacterium]